jgi:hypothetical protein
VRFEGRDVRFEGRDVNGERASLPSFGKCLIW